VLGFAGVDLGGDTLGINPRLPAAWRGISFTVCWRGRSVQVRITGTTVRVAVADEGPMEIRIAGVPRSLTADAPLEVALAPAVAPP